jgi:hypothetical protein
MVSGTNIRMSSRSKERKSTYNNRSSVTNILRDKKSITNKDRTDYSRHGIDAVNSTLFNSKTALPKRENSLERRERRRGHSKEKENRGGAGSKFKREGKSDIPASHFIQHHKHLSRSISQERQKPDGRQTARGKKEYRDDELTSLKKEIDLLRREKEAREKEFFKTNREMKEIKSSLRANQEFLLALKKDMVTAQGQGSLDDYQDSKVYYH